MGKIKQRSIVKIIADITKAQAHSKKPQEKSEVTDIARKTSGSAATTSAFDSRTVNSVEVVKPVGTEESQKDNKWISAIMKATWVCSGLKG